MSPLGAEQQALAALLQRRSSVADDAEANAIATGNDRLQGGAQVEIYREQFFLRHVDALRDDFGSLAHFLGREAFASLARDYLAAHPPSSFFLRDLGQALPSFVTDARLRDLAHVEWAFVEAFDAGSLPALAASDLTSLREAAWASLRIPLQPSVRLLALAYPAHEYRAAVRRSETPPPLTPRPTFLAIYRGPRSLHSLELEPAAHALLTHLASLTPVGEACEVAARMAPSVLAELGGWFQQWTSLGFLAKPRPRPRERRRA